MKVAKGYKQTDIGVVPEDWEVTSLNELFDFKNGLNKEKEYFGYGTPIVNYMDVYKKRGLCESDISGRVFLSKQEIKNYEVKEGDVFFTRTSETVEEIGISSVMLEPVEKTVFSGFVLRARSKNNALNNDYKKYCFSSPETRKEIVSNCTYTTRALTNGKALSKVKIPVPPTAEQIIIANALSETDSLISSLETLIIKKQNIKQAAMQALLTGKRRLKGFKDGWPIVKLSAIGDTYGGLSGKSKKDFENGTSYYIPFLNIMNNPVIDTDFFDMVSIRQGENQNKVRKGDLLFNGSSETPEEVGMCSILLNEVPDLYLNSFCFGFRLKRESLADGQYLIYFLRSTEGRKLIYSLAQGATRYNLSKSNFLQLEIPLPKFNEQVALSQVFSDMDLEIASLETQLSKYKFAKQGMMQSLLTGKVRFVNPSGK